MECERNSNEKWVNDSCHAWKQKNTTLPSDAKRITVTWVYKFIHLIYLWKSSPADDSIIKTNDKKREKTFNQKRINKYKVQQCSLIIVQQWCNKRWSNIETYEMHESLKTQDNITMAQNKSQNLKTWREKKPPMKSYFQKCSKCTL